MVKKDDHVVYHSRPHLKLQGNETKALAFNKQHVLTWRYASANNDSGYVMTWTPSGTGTYDATKGEINLNAPGTYQVTGSWSKNAAVNSHCSVFLQYAMAGTATLLPTSPAFDLPTDPLTYGWGEAGFNADTLTDYGCMPLTV